MRVLRTKPFSRRAHKAEISDGDLHSVALEILGGSFEAALGGGIIKEPMALARRGKRGGARTIVAYWSGTHLFLCTDLPSTNATASTSRNWKSSVC